MNQAHSPALRAGAILVAAVLALGACGRGETSSSGGSQAPGVTDTTVKIGASYALSGPLAANGTAAMNGAKSYFDAINAAGGVKMSDGKTRKIEVVQYDDGYDPARAVQNYRKLTTQDNVFALFQTFGTAPNLAIMDSANSEKVPQLFVHSGAAVFSQDQKAKPYTVGWQPTYETEGAAYAKFLTARDQDLTVAVISQNDDLGKAFVNGFTSGIGGSKVKIVAQETYEATDPTLDSQITKLAASKADVLFSAIAIPKLTAGALSKAAELGWNPEHLLVSLVSSVDQVIKPSGLDGSHGIYSTAFVKAADDQQWAADKDVQDYIARMKTSAPGADPTVPNAAWGYGAAATLVKALQETKDITRDGLVQTVQHLTGSVPLLLPGLELHASLTGPPLDRLHVQQFKDGKWSLIE
ncbi:ABC transporter substrate-binding protein [Planotetraspora thailandica]|uniref:ABC transporter substrate-binding protein n=1 Tax=Planotetraspora thailandica TaxID=487172 RepID=A0A8J3Y0P6_9ACTN|nr:ABC transporter substrate-binding protein [Planotetraspora thailandica]GII58703.1 ABC transporter substrate-binding protein [Planotetraspora thailandica]